MCSSDLSVAEDYMRSAKARLVRYVYQQPPDSEALWIFKDAEEASTEAKTAASKAYKARSVARNSADAVAFKTARKAAPAAAAAAAIAKGAAATNAVGRNRGFMLNAAGDAARAASRFAATDRLAAETANAVWPAAGNHQQVAIKKAGVFERLKLWKKLNIATGKKSKIPKRKKLNILKGKKFMIPKRMIPRMIAGLA